MSTYEQQLERWKSLTKEQQEEILDKHRYIEVEYHDWWEYLEEDFKREMEEIGVRVDKIYFNLSYCQGDYATFEGCVSNWAKFLPKLWPNKPAANAEVVLEFFETHIDFAAGWEHNNRNGLRFSIDYIPPDEDEFPDDFKSDLERDVVFALYESLNMDRDFESSIADFIEYECRELYRTLQIEYESLTCDEQVLECLLIKEMLDTIIDELVEEEA